MFDRAAIFDRTPVTRVHRLHWGDEAGNRRLKATLAFKQRLAKESGCIPLHYESPAP